MNPAQAWMMFAVPLGWAGMVATALGAQPVAGSVFNPHAFLPLNDQSTGMRR